MTPARPSFHDTPAGLWRRLRHYRSQISVFLLLVFLHLAVGCSYYRVRESAPTTTAVAEAQQSRKYIIVHQGQNAWHLKNIVVDEEKREFKGFREPVGPQHLSYQTAQPDRANRYEPRNSKPEYEVHMYIAEYAELEDGRMLVPVSSIKKIEVYDKDMGATVATYVFGTLGVLAGAFVLLIVIILLTKSSCPFVYTHNGQGYRFAGELYGGAIYPSLERDDYLPLPGFTAADGHYQLKISNELLERQYTDLAELLVAGHPEHLQVLLDKHGRPHTLSAPIAPTRALAEDGTDHTATVVAPDSSAYLFSAASAESNALSRLELTFPKPAGATSARLVLNAKNSLWLDYLFGKFNELFGSYYPAFTEKQKRVPAEENRQWALEQGIPLQVYLETEAGWELADYFDTPGPLASRDLVMPIDLRRAKGNEVKLRLVCGFMYWEVDYAALDFSAPVPVQLQRLSPATALDETGADVTALLTATDKQYLAQPQVGNEVVVRYPAPQPAPGQRQTVFLHSRGYYEYIRDFRQKPDLAKLVGFRKNGALSRYSRELYRSFAERPDVLSNAFSQAHAR